jgi:hypothetical protein
MRAYKQGLPLAIMRGLRRGMPVAKRLATQKFMQRKDSRHPLKAFDPANPPPGPLGIRSGNLARSVKIGEMRFTGKSVIATLQAGNKYIRYAGVQEYGGFIYPRNGPYLIFGSRTKTGAFCVVKVPRVRIPPRPYLRPAIKEATPLILQYVVQELRTLARATLKGVARGVV